MTFEDYVLVRGAALVRFARLLTGDDHRAEDLAQEVLVKAYLNWKRVTRADQPDRYVRRMLVNTQHSWWRRRTNHEVSAASLPDRSGVRDPVAELTEREAMWQLILTLPVQQRAVIVLRYYEDFDDVAIAEIMNCATGTVRTHAQRALRKLQANAPLIFSTMAGEAR